MACRESYVHHRKNVNCKCCKILFARATTEGRRLILFSEETSSREEVMCMVTYTELFQLFLVVIGIISLIVSVLKTEKEK